MSVTVTDNRSNTREKPVWKAVVDQYSWASGSSAADATETLDVNGTLRQIMVIVSDNTGNRTVTVALADAHGTLYTTAAQAENATTVTTYKTESDTDLPLRVFLAGPVTITVTPSGDPGSGGMTVDVIFYGT